MRQDVRIGRPALGSVDALALTGANLVALVLRDRAEHLDQDAVDHLHDPHLVGREVRQRGRDVEDLHANALLLEPFEFPLDVGLAAAKAVELLDDERVAAPDDLPFQILIAHPVGVLAGALVDDDIRLRHPERRQRGELPGSARGWIRGRSRKCDFP